MGQPTSRQSQVEARITQSKDDNGQYPAEQPLSATIPRLPTTTTEQGTKTKFQDKAIIHYTHEKRFTTTKKDMHEIFRKAFKCLAIEALRLIVGHRSSPSTQRELIRKRPQPKHLTFKGQQNKTDHTVCQTLLNNDSFPLHIQFPLSNFFLESEENATNKSRPTS
ncbi:unnamed protein product [Rotaria sp. Silwood1]|nr:unnamed protein product [Rotaria sp. Silwood1]